MAANSSSHDIDIVEKVIEYLENECFETEKSPGDGYCPRVFDGYYCWEETGPGTVVSQPCTNKHLMSLNKVGLASKYCTENGSWFISPITRHRWTNLTECGRINIIDQEATALANRTDQIYDKWFPFIKDTSFTGYGLSFVSLILALVIFITLKRLHCERNKLHVNLFISYILRAFMYILKNALFLNGLTMFNDVTEVNGQTRLDYPWMCKIFISIQNYIILSNFILMLMEGLYLHNLIFLNLFSESHGTKVYCLFGWVAPVLFITPWIILKMVFEDKLCWNNKENYYIGLFLDIPIGITVIVNFILFIIIVRVLVLKMHFTAAFIQEKKKKYRKLLKSTLILIPLYGIPYTVSLVLSFNVHHSQILEIIWLFFDQTFTSFQGFFAALVYCLLNSDVRNEVSRKYCSIIDHKEFRRSRTISSNTQQVSLQNNDDALENLNLFGIVDNETLRNGVHLNSEA